MFEYHKDTDWSVAAAGYFPRGPEVAGVWLEELRVGDSADAVPAQRAGRRVPDLRLGLEKQIRDKEQAVWGNLVVLDEDRMQPDFIELECDVSGHSEFDP